MKLSELIPFLNLLKRRQLSSAHQNLVLILLARLVLFAIAELLIAVNYFWVHLPVSFLMVQSILALFISGMAITYIRIRGATRISDQEILLQLLFDVVILTALFFVSGGVANPFVSILLFPLTVSASILPWRYTWVMVVSVMVAYGSLFMLPQHIGQMDMGAMVMPGGANVHGGTGSVFSLHIIGMWINFVISAVLISYFVVKMSDQIRRQQQKINDQREQALRNENLLGIATQAASAAHHIGTPLSTMAIIVDDLNRANESQLFREDLKVLAAQIDNCKQVLDTLRNSAETGQQESCERISVDEFLALLLDEFRILQPGVELISDVEKDIDCRTIPADASLRMALLNVLNNAADASPQKVAFSASAKNGRLQIQVRDFGMGLPANFDGSVIGPVESSKHAGVGLGLFISHATINLYGGQISVANQSEKSANNDAYCKNDASETGTLTRIVLPLEP